MPVKAYSYQTRDNDRVLTRLYHNDQEFKRIAIAFEELSGPLEREITVNGDKKTIRTFPLREAIMFLFENDLRSCVFMRLEKEIDGVNYRIGYSLARLTTSKRLVTDYYIKSRIKEIFEFEKRELELIFEKVETDIINTEAFILSRKRDSIEQYFSDIAKYKESSEVFSAIYNATKSGKNIMSLSAYFPEKSDEKTLGKIKDSGLKDYVLCETAAKGAAFYLFETYLKSEVLPSLSAKPIVDEPPAFVNDILYPKATNHKVRLFTRLGLIDKIRDTFPNMADREMARVLAVLMDIQDKKQIETIRKSVSGINKKEPASDEAVERIINQFKTGKK